MAVVDAGFSRKRRRSSAVGTEAFDPPSIPAKVSRETTMREGTVNSAGAADEPWRRLLVFIGAMARPSQKLPETPAREGEAASPALLGGAWPQALRRTALFGRRPAS